MNINFKSNKKLTNYARSNRKNPTEQERKLWYVFLRRYPVRFFRQYTVDNYILDFYCPKFKLGIELDGSQHYTPEGLEDDRIRTAKIEQRKIHILRIPNNLINNNFKEVCEYIDNIINGKQNI